MGGSFSRTLLIIAALLALHLDVNAAAVSIKQQALYGGKVEQLAIDSAETGVPFKTIAAPRIAGEIFVYWADEDGNEVGARHKSGRARRSVEIVPYGEMVLNAVYMNESVDSDGDGIADGHELYWYGNLDQTADTDTDGDGWTFLEEVKIGRNPLMPDIYVDGGVLAGYSSKAVYNPEGASKYIVKSCPEGALFETIEEYASVGANVSTPVCNHANSKFAYWKLNGVVQRDAFGRALDFVSFEMGSEDVEVIAICEEDESTRLKLYWYGTESVADGSDTDGDGKTFSEEISAGTNPLIAEYDIPLGLSVAMSDVINFNPYNVAEYKLRSEPEGVLFETTIGYAKIDSLIPVPEFDPNDSLFAYWMLDGVPLRDAWGKATKCPRVTMGDRSVEIVAVLETDKIRRLGLYWYGDADADLKVDTDGDGLSFEEEIAAGSNPHFKDVYLDGGVAKSFSDVIMADAQPYERIYGLVVDGRYKILQFGSSPVKPIVADISGDSLWDIVIVSDNEICALENVGTKGSPEFKSITYEAPVVDLSMNSIDKLSGMSLDIAPERPLSATVKDDDMLVSDETGRIWYYHKGKLQNKVWGGTRPGFAEGLQLAAVDWEDDGDLDCLCGITDGRLILLRDPHVGHPTNLRAEAGVDNVNLTWEPNLQSRVRGYKVYRSAGNEAMDGEWANIAKTPLPEHRDYPEILQPYGYRVTSLTRFYTTGNSAPTESESDPSEEVLVELCPNVWLNDTNSFTDEDVEVIVSINNSSGIATEGLKLTFGYDAEVLEPISINTPGLTKDVLFSEDKSTDGVWSISAVNGNIAAGSGRFIELKFHVKRVKGVSNTEVVLRDIAAKSFLGQTINFNLPKVGNIEVYEKEEPPTPVPAGVAMNVSDSHANTLSEFSVPIRVTSTKTLKELAAKVDYDSAIFDFVAASGCDWNDGIITVKGDAPDVVYLTFYAKDQHSIAESQVSLSNVSAQCVDDLAATITVTSGVVYVNDTNVPVAPVVTAGLYHIKVMSGEEFSVPFGLTSVGNLAEATVEIEWDTELITYTGSSKMTFKCEGEYNQFALTGFKMAAIEGLQATSWVKIKSISAIGANGLPATIKSINPDTAKVMVSREIGKYGPGDLDGDGKLTDTDTIILTGYSAYLKMPNALSKNALVKSYQNQYHVNIALTGSAAKAADVNCDGKVDASDISLLTMLVEEAKGIGQ